MGHTKITSFDHKKVKYHLNRKPKKMLIKAQEINTLFAIYLRVNKFIIITDIKKWINKE